MVCNNMVQLGILICLWFAYVNSKSIQNKPNSSCKQAIGVQSGYLDTGDIKTSSSQTNFTATDPWCPSIVDEKQFMAIDLGEDFSISKIATQGKVDDKDRYITNYGLEYSSDAKKWVDYKDIFGKADLDGNKNTYDVVAHDLAPAIIARYVKLKPKKWHNGICNIMDLYGCSIEELKSGKAKTT